MCYRYLAWADGEYMKGYKLLDTQQVSNILVDLLSTPKSYDIYISMQKFDADGRALSCPIYADLDGEHALEDTRDLYSKIQGTYGTPEVFYSGNKGFHVVLNYPVNGANCHKIVEGLVTDIGGWQALDRAVYTNKRLFRICNTFNTKGHRFKVKLSQAELFGRNIDEIRQLAMEPRPYKRDIMYGLMPGSIEKRIEHHNKKAKADDFIRSVIAVKDDSVDYPCIQAIIDNCPIDGFFNKTIVLLARYFMETGKTEQECINTITKSKPYANRENREHDVVKVIRAMYRAGQSSRVNCLYGDGELMLPHCSSMCMLKLVEQFKIGGNNG